MVILGYVKREMDTGGNMPDERNRILLTVTPETFEWLKETASKEHRPVSNLCTHIIEEYREYELGVGPIVDEEGPHAP